MLDHKGSQNHGGDDNTLISAKDIAARAVLPRPYLWLTLILFLLYCYYAYWNIQDLFAFAVLFLLLWVSSSFSYHFFEKHKRSLQAMRQVVDVVTTDWEISLAGRFVSCFTWEVTFCVQCSATLMMLSKTITLLFGEAVDLVVLVFSFVAAFLVIYAALRHVEIWGVSRKYQIM